MTRVTPLLRFLRALTPEDRAEFAANAATAVVYLYQLAGQPQPNPKLRLALQLVAGSKKYAKRAMTPVLTLEDLLVGTEEDPFPTPARSD